jgi:hypothetical protein
MCFGALLKKSSMYSSYSIYLLFYLFILFVFISFIWLSFRRMPSPCEMNEFSVECEEWEEVNGPYSKGKYMMKSNARTKGY